MKVKNIIMCLIILFIGFLIGWKATIYTANIEIDVNNHVAYITAFNNTDVYSID